MLAVRACVASPFATSDEVSIGRCNFGEELAKITGFPQLSSRNLVLVGLFITGTKIVLREHCSDSRVRSPCKGFKLVVLLCFNINGLYEVIKGDLEKPSF
jgi:hypothetical protein